MGQKAKTKNGEPQQGEPQIVGTRVAETKVLPFCESEEMRTGTLKFYNIDRGFGFIKPDDGGPDVFVHVRAAQAAGIWDLAEGMRLSFEDCKSSNGRGPKAVNLKLATGRKL
jgi:cold shock protein